MIPVKVIELEKSFLDTWKFFTPFLNTLTADDKCSLTSRDKWMQTIQMHLSQKQSILSQFICAFFESALNFEHFKKKMTVIPYVSPNLQTTKDVLRYISKNSRLRGVLDRRHGETVRNADSVLIRAPLSSWVITVKVIELQKSLLDTWKFFRPFLNTLTADDKYSLISREVNANNSHAFISKTKHFFAIFFCAFRFCIKF